MSCSYIFCNPVSACVLLFKGMRFLQLKNPWSHLRWKGRYSERDEKNWTPELLKYLNFDPKTAQKFDNGILFFFLLHVVLSDGAVRKCHTKFDNECGAFSFTKPRGSLSHFTSKEGL